MSMDSRSGMIWTGESRRTRGKTRSSATLSTTKPVWTDSGANQGPRGERPATEHLSHGTAPLITLEQLIFMKYFELFWYHILFIRISLCVIRILLCRQIINFYLSVFYPVCGPNVAIKFTVLETSICFSCAYVSVMQNTREYKPVKLSRFTWYQNYL
jgi:hypothetical protein